MNNCQLYLEDLIVKINKQFGQNNVDGQFYDLEQHWNFIIFYLIIDLFSCQIFRNESQLVNDDPSLDRHISFLIFLVE